MNNLISTTIFDIIIACGVIGCAVVYVFSQIRKQDIKTLRESNQDLRDSINDKTKEIKALQVNVDGLDIQVHTLIDKVSELEKQNGDLQNLFRDALILYFKENPEAAKVASMKFM